MSSALVRTDMGGSMIFLPCSGGNETGSDYTLATRGGLVVKNIPLCYYPPA